MQNDNPPQQSAEQATQPQSASATPARSNLTESLMLAFGILAVVSLLIGNGLLLKVSALIFFFIAVKAIVKSATSTQQGSQTPQSGPLQASSQTQTQSAPKQFISRNRKAIKVVGIVVLVIVAAPLIGQLLLVGLFMILLATNHGSMGS